MTAIQIVKLPPSDWPLYKQLRLETLLTEPQAFGSRYDDNLHRPDSYWQARLSEAQAGENGWLLFASENDIGNDPSHCIGNDPSHCIGNGASHCRLVGMIGAYRSEEDGVVEIISVYVTPQKRGQGVANALMSAILEEVSQKGDFHKAVLGVNKAQTAAVALYQRFGFQIVGEKTGIMGDGVTHTGYVMEKELSQEKGAGPLN